LIPPRPGRLDDHRGRLIEPAPAVLEQPVEPREVRDLVAEGMAYGNGVPCESGTPAPPRLIALPVTASAPSVMPWNPFVKHTTSVRPVTFRASFSAASTAFVPAGPGNWTR